MIRISSAINRKSPEYKRERRVSSANAQLSLTSNFGTKSKRYFIRSKNSSHADETLFGKVMQTNNNMNEILNESIRISKPGLDDIKSSKCNKSSEPFFVITNNNIRNLREIVPTDEERFLTLKQSQYQKLLNYQKKTVDSKLLRKTQQIESLQRKEEFRNYDKLRFQKEILSDLQKEKLKEDERIIKRAWNARIDNELDLRELNEMIKNAKVQSIRAHQIAERVVITNEISENEKKLNKFIANETMKDIKKQQELDQKRLKNEYLSAMSIYDQNYNKNKQILADLQNKAEENLIIKQATLDSIEENKAAEEIRMKKQQKVHQELIDDYHASQERKRKEIIEEKLFNQNIMDMQKAKAEKEIAEEELLTIKRNLREKEFSKLREMQHRYRCLQSERDELLEKRAKAVGSCREVPIID